MLAEVEIKNRMGRKEVELKKKDKEAKREEKARFDAANARRLERYEKWSQDEVVRNNERLEKLRHHTKGAFDLAKRLFKKKSGSKTTAIESMAKAKAAQQQQLRVGGYLGLKGDQINFDELTILNSKLAKAMDEPNDSNLVFAQRAYDKAAQAVTDEQAGFERKELGWKEKAKKVQDEKEAKQIERHDKKLDELAIKVHKEQMTKKNRQLRLDAEKYAQETAEKLRWKKAINDVKAKRQAVIDGELKAKKDFQAEVDAKEKKKKAEAPGLLVNAKEKKYKERSEKYDGSKMSGASAAFIAKRMKFRACEELVHAKKQLKAADKKAGGEEMLGETGEGDVDKEPKSAAFCQNQFKSRL